MKLGEYVCAGPTFPIVVAPKPSKKKPAAKPKKAAAKKN
jgi:hypothetical protein